MRKPVGLALQGGGSWGAYTWGVLDALLASRTISIAQLSGTSAGAINAAIVASAIAEGRPAEARRRLRSFWLAVAKPAAADFGRELWGPVERHWRETVGTWLVASAAVSPYQANPLGLNPLRDAIAAHVDIDAIRRPISAATLRHADERQVRAPAGHFQRRDDNRRRACISGRRSCARRWRSTVSRTGTAATRAT
jgi:predicted acylesterase/phospholipase RssA